MTIHRPVAALGSAVLAIAILGTALAPAAMAAPASREGARTIPVIVYDRFTVQNKVKTSNYTNKAQTLADCLVTRAGSHCTIIKQSTASRSIGLALGASRGIVSSSLNISGGTSESVSIQCTSPALPKNGRFRAWPRGDRFTYKVKRETIVSNAVASRSTSATLTAFNPKKNTITCG